MEFHSAAPAGFVADHRRDRKLEAFRRQQKRLLVKVGVPGVDRHIRRGEQLHQARPDLCECWRAGELGIGYMEKVLSRGKRDDRKTHQIWGLATVAQPLDNSRSH